MAMISPSLTMSLYQKDANTHELSKRSPLNPLCPILTPKFKPIKLGVSTLWAVFVSTAGASLNPPAFWAALAAKAVGKKVPKKVGKTFCKLG